MSTAMLVVSLNSNAKLPRMATAKTLEPWQLEDANRLDALFKERAGLSQAAFGAQFEIGNQSMVWQYLKGRRPLNIAAASKFAKGLQVSIEEFSPTLAQQISNASEHSTAPSIDDEFVVVRRIDAKVSAGRGQVAYSEDTKHGLSFRADFLNSAGAGAEYTVSMRIDGRSMEPTLPDGSDTLFNLKAKDIVNGKIYAFRCDGELSVKRLFETQDGHIIARSDNPEFEEVRITDRCTDFEVIGRAFWMGVKL